MDRETRQEDRPGEGEEQPPSELLRLWGLCPLHITPIKVFHLHSKLIDIEQLELSYV